MNLHQQHRRWTLLPMTLAALLTAGCLGGTDDSPEVNVRPAYLSQLRTASYDGVSDDLLTAGLGKTGLGAAVAPATSATPTAAELRRLAILEQLPRHRRRHHRWRLRRVLWPERQCTRRGR